MGLLVLVLGLCCAGLILLAGLLLVMVRGRSAEDHHLVPQSAVAAESLAQVRTQYDHPRMDLASGNVPANQAVDLDRQRDRWLEHESSLRNRRSAKFAPFAERRKLPRARRQRLDLVYARENMGDLSDPDLRPAHQWIADLQLVVSAE